MILLAATNNKKKLTELREIFSGFCEIISLTEAGIEHETVEDGTTFAENALKKAREAAQISGMPTVADDSGLVVDALNGEPGVYSARYAGSHGDDEANLAKVFESMRGKTNRSARYVCAIAYVNGDDERVVTGIMEGEIALRRAGDGGFGYDPIFYLPRRGCTAAELSAQEKNAVSHRGKAVRMLADSLKNGIK